MIRPIPAHPEQPRPQAEQSKGEAVKADLTQLLHRHTTADCTAPEILAVAAQLVGMLLALQDQQTMTPKQAFGIIDANIQIGNETVLTALFNSGGAA